MGLHFDTGEDLCREIAKRTEGVCMLSFSAGKDSIVAWLQLRKFFHTIHPIYLYRVPGLEFVEERMRYYEDFFGQKIMQLPHPSTYRQLNRAMFQAPENLKVLDEVDLEEFSYDFAFAVAADDLKLPVHQAWVATGVRAADNPKRQTSIRKSGVANEERQQFFPVFDWNMDRLEAALIEAKVKLSVDYKLFGRSFDGLDYRFLKPIKDNFPRDFERILEFFPLAELELFRMECRERYYGVTA